jgi:uncharacterized membrane protein YeaQ/YmgE (transglycosylase-associated protein family)
VNISLLHGLNGEAAGGSGLWTSRRHGVRHRNEQEQHMSIIAWIVLGMVAGWLAGQFMKGGGYGLIGDVVLGVIGAIVCGFLSSTLLGVDVTGFNVVSVMIAFVGACIVIGISRPFTTSRTVRT